MNSISRFLLPLLLLLPVGAAGQQDDSFISDLRAFIDMRADKAYAKLDSTYIGRYPYHWNARLFYNASGLHIVTDGPATVRLSSGMSNRVGIGLDYRGLGLSYSKALGKHRGLEFSFDSYSPHFCFEYDLRASVGNIGELEMATTLPDTDAGLAFFSTKLNLFYSFNPRFSFEAAMKQTRIQRRSAGTFITALCWSAWDIAALNEDGTLSTLDFFKANYFHNRFSLGAGYGYNLVLGHQHWLLHASLVPMWTVYEMNILRVEYDRTKQNYPFGWVSFAGTGRAGIYYRWGDRWSAGMSGIIDQMVSHNFVRKSHPETVYKRFGSQEWVARFSLYCRF